MYKGANHQVSANNCQVMYVLIPAFIKKKENIVVFRECVDEYLFWLLVGAFLKIFSCVRQLFDSSSIIVI